MHLLKNSAYIDLHTLALSGQLFRMLPYGTSGHEYTIIHKDTVIYLQQEGELVYFQTYPEPDQTTLVSRLFRDDVDMDKLCKSLERDIYSAHAVASTGKLWLLAQDHWETLISFIVSQNKHFLHIQQCIDTLCKTFGKKVSTDIGDFFLFPTPEALAEAPIESISKCKVGYRDVYIQRAAQRVMMDPGILERINSASDSDAADLLTSFYGIGGKVADCILVFAYARDGLVPYDTWLQRIMKDLYDIEQHSYEHFGQFNLTHFGEYAGWVQQYMFYHARRVFKRGMSLRDTWFDL